MYLIMVRSQDGVDWPRRSSVEVCKGDVVIIGEGVRGTRIGVVAGRKRIPWPSKYDSLAEIEAVVVPIVPHNYVETEFGTICRYNMRVPGEIRYSCWQKNSDDVYLLTGDFADAEDKLRQLFTEQFFKQAEKELGDDS